MASATAQPLALPATGGAPPPSVRIEPAVLLSIADAHGRRPADGGADRVIGTLLGGFAPDGAVDVRDCFTVPHSETAEQVRGGKEIGGGFERERENEKVRRSMFFPFDGRRPPLFFFFFLLLLLLTLSFSPRLLPQNKQKNRSPSTSPTTPTSSPSTAGSPRATPSSAGSPPLRRARRPRAATRSSTTFTRASAGARRTCPCTSRSTRA